MEPIFEDHLRSQPEGLGRVEILGTTGLGGNIDHAAASPGYRVPQPERASGREPDGLVAVRLVGVSGDPTQGQATLSSAPPMRLHKHGATTSIFAAPEDRAARNATVPPPPSTGVFRASLRMHRPLTSMFGRRLLRLLGQFVGTYSVLAYAACARWSGSERPARCGFAVEVGSGEALRTHAQGVRMQVPHSESPAPSAQKRLDWRPVPRVRPGWLLRPGWVSEPSSPGGESVWTNCATTER
jgi:hypothetical protein